MTAPLRIALIGAGRIAHMHAAAIEREPEAELVAVIDVDQGASALFAERYGAGWAGTEMSAAFENVRIDAVIVCSPTSLHRDHALMAIAAGAHVLVEKPFARDRAEAEQIVLAAAGADVRVMSAQVLRFLPMFVWAKQFITRGKLGAPVQSIERRLVDRDDNYPWWKDLPAFLVSHWGSHSIDVLCHLFDDSMDRVYCQADSIRSEFGVIDDFSLQARFRSGLRATSVMSFSSRKQVHDLVIIGTDATLEFDCYSSVRVDGEIVLELSEDEMLEQGFAAQLSAFIAGVSGTEPLQSSGSAVLSSLAGLQAAELSTISGEVVVLER